MQVLPNGVKYPTSTDTVSPEALLTEMAKSFSDAIGGLGTGKRQPRTFRVANQAEKNGLADLTNLVDGDQVYVGDTAWWEMYLSGWKIWRTTRGISFPFAYTNISVGGGASFLSYMLDGDLVRVTGSFRIASDTVFSSGTSGALALPVPHWVTNEGMLLGTCAFISGGTNSWNGIVTANSGGTTATLRFYAGGAQGQLAPFSNTVPVGWPQATSYIALDLRYRRTV